MNLQALQLLDDILAGRFRTDLGIHVQDLAVRADVERPACGELVLGINHAVSGSYLFLGVAEDGIVRLDMLGELLVRLGIIDARSKVDDVGEGPDGSAALTERPAFRCSATGERLGEPRENYRLALVVR